MASAVTAASAVKSTAAPAEACASARGITASLAAMVIAAEAARASASLAARLIESPRGLRISVERRVPPAGMVVNAAGIGALSAAVHVVGDTAFTAAAVVIVA